MELPPQIQRLSTLNESDLKRETERLRSATAMTSYKGYLMPKGGLQKKGEEDDEDKKKKMVLVALVVVLGYFFYANMM